MRVQSNLDKVVIYTVKPSKLAFKISCVKIISE